MQIAVSYFFLPLLLCVLFLEEGYGQASVRIQGKSLVELHREKPVLPSIKIFFPFRTHHFETVGEIKAMPLSGRKVPVIYSYDNLGLFCKLEVQLEKAVNLPIKIRLGDVQYVDWLEGKEDLPLSPGYQTP